jgi:predicted CXXCH cytochrome family protein
MPTIKNSSIVRNLHSPESANEKAIMARLKNTAFLILCIGALQPVFSGNAVSQTFHSGGAGACNGCHIIHQTQSGPGQMLLQASDPSSICLNCHAGPGGSGNVSVFSPDGSAMTPGGDFYWLTRTFSWVGGQSPGYSHGHSIVARDYNLVQDPMLLNAPGGSYPAARLGCTSCHDPHGKVGGGTEKGGPAVSGSGSYGDHPFSGTSSGNYRLLGDSDYSGGATATGYSFTTDAPVARQSSINRFGESDLSHVDYGSGMSEWCGNCHSGILNSSHEAGGGTFEHPAGNNEKLESDLINLYNTYIRTGELSGNAATSYLQFVPFERGVQDPALLDPNSTRGPDANANVMCLTCHRAHASAFENSGRWDFKVPLLSQSHPALGDAGATASDVYFSYYGRDITVEFGSGQRQFCEKCHGAGTP